MKNVSFKLTSKLRGSAAFHDSCTSHVSCILHFADNVFICRFHFGNISKGQSISCPLDQSPIEQKVEKPEELLRCTGHSLDDIIARYNIYIYTHISLAMKSFFYLDPQSTPNAGTNTNFRDGLGRQS